MVWSISKDDDGLEPAIPRPGHGTDDRSVRQHRSTVVVDPVSQIPEPMENARRSPRRAEPTRILSARKMDQLRAQVAKHQRLQHRRQWVRLVTWGAAGALAVALGGIMAGGVLPRLDNELWQRLVGQWGGNSRDTASAATPAQRPLSPPAEALPKTSALPQQASDDRAASARELPSNRAVSLDELEAEDESTSDN